MDGGCGDPPLAARAPLHAVAGDRQRRGDPATFTFRLIALLLAQGPAVSLPERRIDIGDITVFVDRSQVALATGLGEAASVPHDWYGLGRLDTGPLLLIVARDEAEFRRLSHDRLPSWGAGVTIPDSRVVIIRLDAGDPYETLRHELAHVVLHREVPVRVPLWFDEGYAVVAAHELGRFATLRLNLAVATGHLPELAGLNSALRGNALDAETAYALAGSAVAELGRQTRTGQLSLLMQTLERGVPFDQAVEQSTGFTLDQFDEVWHRSMRQHYNWLIWFATGGMWLGLAAVLAWISATRRRRDAPRRAALDHGWPQPVDDETITIQQVESPST